MSRKDKIAYNTYLNSRPSLDQYTDSKKAEVERIRKFKKNRGYYDKKFSLFNSEYDDEYKGMSKRHQFEYNLYRQSKLTNPSGTLGDIFSSRETELNRIRKFKKNRGYYDKKFSQDFKNEFKELSFKDKLKFSAQNSIRTNYKPRIDSLLDKDANNKNFNALKKFKQENGYYNK